METIKLKVDGMTCGGCSSRAEKLLIATDGIESVSVSHTENSATITFEPEKVSLDKVIDVIENAGFEVAIIGDHLQ